MTAPAQTRAFMTRSGASPPSITGLQKVYSITSSARASKVAGTSRWSALAVCILMINSNLVGGKRTCGGHRQTEVPTLIVILARQLTRCETISRWLTQTAFIAGILLKWIVWHVGSGKK